MRNCALLFLALTTLVAQDKADRKVFVVDKVTQTATAAGYGNVAKAQQGEHHSAPVVIAAFAKSCPSVKFTENQEDAAFILKTQQGSSTLTSAKGDILFVSPAHTLGNMVKDVCGYINSH